MRMKNTRGNVPRQMTHNKEKKKRLIIETEKERM
jgi:hypothetical protein